jgi:peptidyl-prolyl cis-trans isomerase D
MLQRIGDALKGKRALAYLLLLPLALMFALWGAVGVVELDFFGPQNYAAKVNGNSIPVERANEVWRDQQSRLLQQMPELPEDTRKALQDGLLEQLISETLVTERTAEFGYRVDENRVRAAIEREEAFQVDGKYSETLALARLAQVGLTPDKYRADLRATLQNSELQRAIQVSEFLTATEAQRRLALENEQREVRYAVWPLERFQGRVSIDEAAIAEYHARNPSQFQTPESVRLQYAELRLDQVASQVTVAETDLQDLYAKNRDRYSDAEKRRPRHILIAVNGADDAGARTRAEAILAELRGGKDFASVAREVSADSGSAAQGGDLGWSERSVFVGPFADAVFTMKDGELRGPVKTEFGYHLIRLDGIQAARLKTFEEARVELEGEFRRDRAADVFGDRQEQVQRRLEQGGVDLPTLVKDFGLASGEVPEFLRNTGEAD